MKKYILLPLFLTVISTPAFGDDTTDTRRPPVQNPAGAPAAAVTPAGQPASDLPPLPPAPPAQQQPMPAALPPVAGATPQLPAPTQPVTPSGPSQKQLSSIAHTISKQVKACWKLGKDGRATTPLTVVIDLDPQGNMKFNQFTTEPTADQQKLADSIKAAIADPACNPVRSLPDAKLYDSWKHVALKFNPKK